MADDLWPVAAIRQLGYRDPKTKAWGRRSGSGRGGFLVVCTACRYPQTVDPGQWKTNGAGDPCLPGECKDFVVIGAILDVPEGTRSPQLEPRTLVSAGIVPYREAIAGAATLGDIVWTDKYGVVIETRDSLDDDDSDPPGDRYKAALYFGPIGASGEHQLLIYNG